jgi:hypothetical protein
LAARQWNDTDHGIGGFSCAQCRQCRIRESSKLLPPILDPPVKPALRRAAIERHREIAERIRRVARPVVHRMRAQSLELVIVVRAVELERVDAARTSGCLEWVGVLPSASQAEDEVGR